MQRQLSLIVFTTLSLLGLVATTGSLAAQSLQLADGRVLLASVEDADGDRTATKGDVQFVERLDVMALHGAFDFV